MDTETQLLTIAETARELKVSTVTVQRWLKQGRLRAYRLGPRRIRVQRTDLDKLLVPLSREEINTLDERVMEDMSEILRPMTEAEVRDQLVAISEARALREQMLAERNGRPFPESWPEIRAARQERSKRL